MERRVGVVMITQNRRAEALRSVGRLLALGERPPVVVVDNGSSDGTADALRSRYPAVEVVASAVNLGAVGRNVGVCGLLRTPYVAFCDDDAWWEPGSPWVLAERRRVPPAVEARLAALNVPQRQSTARRYVG